MYTIIRKDKEELIPSSDIKVGDIIEITANQRVPADCLLLSCSDP
jgi:P-type E1-E2 ATPase